jgi:hypothetical protein
MNRKVHVPFLGAGEQQCPRLPDPAQLSQTCWAARSPRLLLRNVPATAHDPFVVK